MRALAAGELALGLVALITPGRTALALAAAYVGFAVAAGRARRPAGLVRLLRGVRRAGLARAVPAERRRWPASPWPPRPGRPAACPGCVHRPAGAAITLAVGTGACVYGLVVAYTQLPAAWSAWSAP